MRVEAATARREASGVTVVVPCYNYGRFLGSCLSSILHANADVDTEVILIDDASTDGSDQVAAALASVEPRIRLIRHERNIGHIATYNEGLVLASKEYVALLSADDMLTPGALGRALAIFERHPEVGLVYGRVLPLGPGEVALPTLWPSSHTLWRGSEWISAVCRSGNNPIGSPEAVVRTSVQHVVGGYDPDHPHAGDLHMWLRVAAVSDVGRVNRSVQAIRRLHPDQMMHGYYNSSAQDFIERQGAFDAFLNSVARLDQAEMWRRSAHRALAVEALDRAILLQRTGTGTGDQVADLIEFAHGTGQDLQATRAWREYELLQHGRSKLALSGLRVRRGLDWRWRLARQTAIGV